MNLEESEENQVGSRGRVSIENKLERVTTNWILVAWKSGEVPGQGFQLPLLSLGYQDYMKLGAMPRIPS